VCAEFKRQSVSNTTALTKPLTTTNLHNAVKPMRKLIPLGSKPRKVNPTLILSNVQTAKVNIKLILLTVCSGNIGLTRNGTSKNTPKFKKIENNQFVQL